MPKEAFLIIGILFTSFLIGNSFGFLTGDTLQPNIFHANQINITQYSEIIQILSNENSQQNPMKRYLIFGQATTNDVDFIEENAFYTAKSQNRFFSVGIFPEHKIGQIKTQGYHVIEDFLLDFHSTSPIDKVTEISQIGKIVGSEKAFENYEYTGKGIKIAIVDTGVDFSNPDIQDSLARDENNFPIMLDADGQGIVITNATFIANIDKDRILRNYTKTLPDDVTSTVFVNRDGVFLDVSQNGDDTIISVYNSLFPMAGNLPVFNGTLSDNMKIGNSNRDYIVSRSGIYHLGVIYQGVIQGPFTRIQVVPVLVVDSTKPGLYDTIIPDMSTSWEDFTRFDLENDEKPDYDFDFTDETPIKLGKGNEFLVYDFNDDEKLDYSAGTVGARVLDIYGVINHTTPNIDDTLNAINGTLLDAIDKNGNYFGVMTDFFGHGTATASSITSKGIQEYDIYNNTKKYTIKGVAPNSQIIPIKALWFGDTVYAWLWAAGFDNDENKWTFNGKPRADIISNSWGVSHFPNLQSAPGLDILSLILNALVVPKSLDENYPGVTIVSSAGNSGHGYGTLGLPSAASFGITVGATTNNVFVGYGSFKDQPRFGNTTDHANNVVDFSSRGPGIIGDPKPDIMSIGAFSFTPASVTKMKKDSTREPFALFGGTSMAAPLVSGSAAILMESLKEQSIEYDPFKIKNILMSTASDLYNDPFTQGAGLVNVNTAVKFVHGDDGIFIVYNDKSYTNTKEILDISFDSINATVIGFGSLHLPKTQYNQTGWFGGHLLPGERSTTTFTIENPSDKILDIQVLPQNLKLIKQNQFNGITDTHQQDSILNKSGTYIPNYIRLNDVKEFTGLASFYDDSDPIPDDASLMILNVNFPFENFMNQTDDVYANDMKISSVYLYDWKDQNNNTRVDSDEISMVNRGGSWGTVQELSVSEPNTKFENTPVVGVYPVPTRFSYWSGNTNQNSTSMNYELTASYYKKDKWDTIWLNNEFLQIPAKSSSEVVATIVVPEHYQSGVYQGFITFSGDFHTVNVPTSFVVKQKATTDKLVVITGSEGNNPIFGTGYVKGAFDMANRFMAGDWRQYYFDIDNEKINTAAIEISWKNPDTNLAAFMIDPAGRIVQTNVPAGVFGEFMNWPSLDWLGTTSFSQGGGFFPVKNKDDTSTVLYAPINKTGTYSLLVHSTLFDGQAITEPIEVAVKFTTILVDKSKPQIQISIPDVINSSYIISPEIIDENLDYTKYFLDGQEIQIDPSTNFINPEFLTPGFHELAIQASDIVGNEITETYTFTVQDEQPTFLDETKLEPQIEKPEENSTLIVGIIIGIAIGVTSVILATKKIKILQKH